MQRIVSWLIDGDFEWDDFDGAPEELQYPLAVELLDRDFTNGYEFESLGTVLHFLQNRVDWEPYAFKDEEVFDLPVVLIKGTKLIGVAHKWDDNFALVVFVEDDTEYRVVISWDHLSFIDQITIKHRVTNERQS